MDILPSSLFHDADHSANTQDGHALVLDIDSAGELHFGGTAEVDGAVAQPLQGDGSLVAHGSDAVLLVVYLQILTGLDFPVDGVHADAVAVVLDLLRCVVTEDDEHPCVPKLLHSDAASLDLVLVNDLHSVFLLFIKWDE
jgi:hypothetical protein